MPKKGPAIEDWWGRLRKHLKTHAGLTVIVVAAILLQGISSVQYYYTRSLLADELETRAESELSIKAVIVKNLLSMSENSLSGHIWDLKRNIIHPDSSYSVMERVLKSHSNLTGCWVAFVPEYYPEKGRLFEPFAWWDHGKIRNAEMVAEGHDYTQNRYYKTVIATDTPMWTDVYHEDLMDMDLVTYIVPIHDSREDIVAMFGLDMSANLLSDTLDYRHIYPSSYIFLLTEKGQLIVGPRHKKEKKREEMQQIIRMINDSTVEKSLSKSGRSHVFPIRNADGDEGMVFYATFKGKPKWQIAVVCYDKEVYAKLINMRRTIGLLTVLALLVLGLVIARFAKNDRKLQKANMEQERIGSELRIATHIQKEMLPKTFPPYPDRDDIDVYGVQIPAREVGGDLFDFFLRNEKLFFCIGDVSGKGVPSAMVMAVIHSLFRMASAHENNPARIMQTINETSCERNESNIFVTCFIGVLDLPTGYLRYCDAGHEAPLVLFDGQWSTVNATPHLPIGVFNDVKYGVEEIQVQPDSTIFLYTDGLTEAKRASKQMFGLERTKEVLDKCARRQLTPRQILEAISEEVHQFVGDAEQSDDLTMLAIRYTPRQFESTLMETLTIENDVHEVTRFSQFMKSVTGKLGLEQSLARQLRLAVEEAVVNVIDYAYPTGTKGDVTVKVMSNGHALHFQIIDSGVAFDPTVKENADTTLSAEDRQIGGLGILLVRELMDSVNYERIEGKNVLTLIKYIK